MPAGLRWARSGWSGVQRGSGAKSKFGDVRWSDDPNAGAPTWPAEGITDLGRREVESMRASEHAQIRTQARYELICLVAFLLFLVALGNGRLHEPNTDQAALLGSCRSNG